MVAIPRTNLPPIGVPVIDRATGLMTESWYRFYEGEQGGVSVNTDASTAAQAAADAAQTTANGAVPRTRIIATGTGLAGGGDLETDLSLSALQDTGWTAGTGTANKGADASYAGQTVSAGYVQAEAQATDNAVKAVSQRVRALENALRANGGIDG